jgi:glycosyltransferase involved in cell wall biosynthesis
VSPTPVVIAPSLPRRADASDGQSVYAVEAAHALARQLGAPLHAFALRLGDEPAEEQDGPLLIHRIDPGTSIAGPFALYEAAHFDAVMTRLAWEVARRIPHGAPALVHGYELGPTAARLRASGHRVVGVLHYLLAQETERYLAGADDPFRRAVMPSALARVAASCPAALRGPAVRVASASAGVWSRGVAGALVGAATGRLGAGIVAHQLRKLAMERQLTRAADVVVGVSRGFADAIARHHPGARVAWCHAGYPDDVQPAPWSPAPRVRLLAVGRPTPQKGWDVLVRALARLERERPEVADALGLTLVGGTGAWAGPHSAFGVETRRALSALGRVTVTDAGRLPREAVLARYGEADALVLPSDYEPFGLVVLEAMAAGCPVIAFDTDGPRDLLADGESGVLVRAGGWEGRTERLADALATLTTRTPEAWTRMRAAARARAQSFTWTRTAAAHAAWLSGRTAP